jgi:hypothetical protein
VPEAAVIGLLVAFPVVGAAFRRWAALALPVVGWPLFYVGLNEEWWGYGTGDGWPIVAAALTVVGTAATALGVWAGRARAQRR